MKCEKCGSEWKTDASRSASITVCPFCQEKIVTGKPSDWQFFDNTKELLAYVATEYGTDALFGRKYFSDHTLPSMPQGQKNLVKQAFECGIVTILQDNLNSDQAHKEIAVKQVIRKLMEIYSITKNAAERVVWEFTNAIGWGMPEPQEQSNQQNGTTMQGNSGNATSPPVPLAGLSSLMKLAAIGLQNGDWQEAEDYYKDVLKQSPEYAPAWIGRLCVDLKLSEEGKLAVFADLNKLTRHRFFQTAMRFADPTIKARLDGYVQNIKDRIEAEKKAVAAEAERKRKLAEEAAHKKRVQDIFVKTCKMMGAASNSDDYRKVIASFENINSNYLDINSKIKERIAECEKKIVTIEVERKAAAVEAERQQKIAKEAARKKPVQDAFNSACEIIDNAKSQDDYYKAIVAFNNIDSNYQDINNQIKSKIAECEKKKAAIEAALRQKYGVLLDRLSSEGKAQAGERRKAAQAQLDKENAKAKAAVETKCAQLQQQYDADYKVWQEKVHELKAPYEIAYKNWEEEVINLKAQSETWKSRNLCPHDGGTLKGLLLKKCTACGKAPSEPITVHPAPKQPKYPPECVFRFIRTGIPEMIWTAFRRYPDMNPKVCGQ